MANSQRRILDRNGNQFIPMNVEGQSYSDNFWTTTKVIVLAALLLCGGSLIAFLSSENSKPMAWVILFGGYLIISLYVTRYVIFEEKFYYRMYKELPVNGITTPAKFWNIASIKNTEDGAILTYADAKVGILVKLDRDTVTGKPMDFEETHYDAISDFYKELTKYGYSFVQLNIMEMAGKDPRLAELDKITLKCDNDNIRKLVELQVGHIKNIAQNSLYESEYILVYSTDITRIDHIIPDTIEIMFTILNGGYIGYRIMSRRDLIELEKESFGVKYFNSTDASLNIYKNDSNSANVPFRIQGIKWSDGEVQELDNMRKHRLRVITDNIVLEKITLEEANIREQIYEKKKEETPVDFSKLSSVPGQNNQRQRFSIPRPNANIPRPNINITKPNLRNENQLNDVNTQNQFNNQQYVQSDDVSDINYNQDYIDNDFGNFIDYNEDDDDIVDI